MRLTFIRLGVSDAESYSNRDFLLSDRLFDFKKQENI